MTEIRPIVNTVAERQLTFVDSSGEEQLVTVRIGVPYLEQEGGWRCPYEIQGSDRTKRFGMVGIDSMQALILSTQILKTELSAWAKRHNGTFRWLSDDADTGFSDVKNEQ